MASRLEELFSETEQEVIHIDSKTKEKHIADIKTKNEMVIELQNSAQELQKLKKNLIQCREEFRKRKEKDIIKLKKANDI